MKIPFIHIADVHLGRLQGRMLSGQQLAQRRTDAMLSLLTTLAVVRDEQIPLLLVAGDLFDNQLIDRSVVNELRASFAALDDTQVCIVAGNHDFADAHSYYRTLDWPGNVHIFAGEWEAVRLDALNLTVHGCSFVAPECEAALLRSCRIPNDQTLHIAVMHADYTAGVSRYMPFNRTDLAACGADYIALGHQHASQAFGASGDVWSMLAADPVQQRSPFARAAYCGALEPLDFGEEGAHGYIRGELEKGGAHVSLVPVARRSYHNVIVDVSDAETTEEVIALASQALKDVSDSDLVRLVLRGQTAPDFVYDRVRLAMAGSRFFSFEVEDKTTPEDDLTSIADGFTVRAYFVRRMLTLMETGSEAERQRASRALKIGLNALAGREATLQ